MAACVSLVAEAFLYLCHHVECIISALELQLGSNHWRRCVVCQRAALTLCPTVGAAWRPSKLLPEPSKADARPLVEVSPTVNLFYSLSVLPTVPKFG